MWILELTDYVNWNDGRVISAKVILECDEGILEDEIKGGGAVDPTDPETRDECVYCDYVPYFVMCYPDLETGAGNTCGWDDNWSSYPGSTCDKQAFSFWQNQILPHKNFDHSYYNLADETFLAPYNFTAYWLEDKDPDWFRKYIGVVESSVRPADIYLEPITH